MLAISLVFGAATAVVADMLAQQSEREGKLQRIVRYTNYKQLPAALRHRIISYYAFHLQSAQMSDDSVLNSLPRSLKLQIDVVTHQQVAFATPSTRRFWPPSNSHDPSRSTYSLDALAGPGTWTLCVRNLTAAPALFPTFPSRLQVFLKLPLFRLCEREEILMLTQSLRPGLALPDEALVREGEYGVGLFFLMKGGVEVLKQGQRVCFVYAVAAFGESALLRDAKPVATVRAVRFCEVNVLMRVDFERVAVLNPNILRYLQLYTVQRDAQMKEQTALERDKGRPTQGRSSPARPFDDGDEGSLRGTQRHVTIRESFNDTIRRSFRRLSLNTVTPVPAVVPPPSAATAGAEGAGALGQEPATADDDDDGSIERSVVERIKLTDMDHREHQATHR